MISIDLFKAEEDFRVKLRERFFGKTKISEEVRPGMDTPCLEWTGRRNNEYGRTMIGVSQVYAHRVAWELENGEIPTGMCVLHRCDNPPCVRPDHLFLGTRVDNNWDMYTKGRQSMPPHPRGSSHPRAKLTNDGVRMVFGLRKSGFSLNKIAIEVGVSKRQVGRILSGESWTEAKRT